MPDNLLSERAKNIWAHRGSAIPPAILIVGGVLWDIWLLTGHVSTAAWLYSFLPESWKHGWKMPQVMLSAWGPPLWMFLAALLWLALLAFWPPRESAIRGEAELLAVRLDMSDLRVDKDWALAADFGVFVRMNVAVTDKPRTIKKFLIDVWTFKDGKIVEPAAYCAESEKRIGEYLYRHNHATTNSYGFAIEEETHEEMPDLMARLEQPLAPHTGTEGWVRFEMKGVKHELKECRIEIHAIDVHDRRYEIETDRMRVKSVEERAYVISKRGR